MARSNGITGGRIQTWALGGVVIAAAVTLAACSSDDAAEVETPDTEQALVAEDFWIKATDDSLTGAFGTITNTGSDEVELVAATATLAGVTELHEMAMDDDGAMVMQEIEGGLPLPAGGELILEPGGNHLMLLDLSDDIEPGDEVTINLGFSDGTDLTVAATAKDYSGANETYDPDDADDDADDGADDMDDMDSATDDD